MDTSEDPLLKTIAETRRFLVDNGFAEVVGLHLTDPETAAEYGNPVQLKTRLAATPAPCGPALPQPWQRLLG